MNGFSTEPFCGTEFRVGEVTSAILRQQFKKLDGIVRDLKKNKALLIEALGDGFDYVPCNDPEGDSAIAISFRFDSEEKCKAFAEKIGATIPGYTGKHVYNDWKPILEKRGAAHPLMDPFKMDVNKNVQYSEDMYAKSLDIMKKCAHIFNDPDWTVEEINALAERIKEAVK